MYVNWYKLAQIEKEAGLVDYIPSALLFAVISIISASAFNGYIARLDIEKTAQEYGVNESDIESILKNQRLIDAISKYQEPLNQPQEINRREPLTKNPELKQNVSKPVKKNQEEKIQINIIARTLYAEGKSESEEGLMAIASVIYNRSNKTASGMVDVIKQPKQFSCWNQASKSDWTNLKQNSGPIWDKSMEIAKSMVNGGFQPSGTWKYYFNPDIVKPSWAYKDKDKKQPRQYVEIGNHRFISG